MNRLSHQQRHRLKQSHMYTRITQHLKNVGELYSYPISKLHEGQLRTVPSFFVCLEKSYLQYQYCQIGENQAFLLNWQVSIRYAQDQNQKFGTLYPVEFFTIQNSFLNLFSTKTVTYTKKFVRQKLQRTIFFTFSVIDPLHQDKNAKSRGHQSYQKLIFYFFLPKNICLH